MLNCVKDDPFFAISKVAASVTLHRNMREYGVCGMDVVVILK